MDRPAFTNKPAERSLRTVQVRWIDVDLVLDTVMHTDRMELSVGTLSATMTNFVDVIQHREHKIVQTLVLLRCETLPGAGEGVVSHWTLDVVDSKRLGLEADGLASYRA